jgi:hypothetical protein
MLNWRRDPGYEHRKMQHEWRMRQIDERTRQLEREILQVRIETEQLRQENTRGRQWLASMDALCFPPDANSTPAIATEPDSKPSSP